MTRAMLSQERRQGVDLVVATPHFYANRASVTGFLDARVEALEKAEKIRRDSEEPLPEILVGAEVYYFPGIGEATEISRLCVKNTRTLLLEMPFEQWDEQVLRNVRHLRSKQGLRIVLAHIERYVTFQRRRDVWDRVLAMDIAFQINAGSFLDRGGFLRGNRKRRFCEDFVRIHPETIIGSDCHNVSTRRPNLADGRAVIADRLGKQALNAIDSAALRALERPAADADE